MKMSFLVSRMIFFTSGMQLITLDIGKRENIENNTLGSDFKVKSPKARVTARRPETLLLIIYPPSFLAKK